jgi:hypothetical protein
VSNGTGTISAITVVANGCRYMRVGTTLAFTLQFTFTMAGAGGGDTQLTFDLPGGLTATAQQVAAARVFDTGAVYDGLGIIFTSSNTKFFVNKIPTAAFGNGAGNAIQGTVVIETTT